MSDLPREMSGYENVKNLNAEQAVNRLNTALAEQRPINMARQLMSPKLALGDAIIQMCPVNSLLEAYTNDNNLPKPKYFYDQSTINDFRSEETLAMHHTLSLLDTLLDRPKKVYLGDVQKLSHALGIDLPKPILSHLYHIPNAPWLKDFSRDITNSKRADIERMYGTNIAAVVQTGSSPIKRWAPEHIIQASETASPYLSNDTQLVILSDAKIVKDNKSQKTLSDYGTAHNVPVVFFESVPELAAYAGLSSVFMGTDSGPAWVWEAERIDAPDNLALIHHTLTSSFWQIPRGTPYISQAVRNNPLEKSGFLPSPSVYEKYYHLSDAVQPAQEDVDDFCRSAEQSLQKRKIIQTAV